MSEMIRIAIQKSGRLSEDSLNLIRECGIQFNNGTGKLKSEAANFPAEFLSLRDDDIPGYVADGVADIGIVGENVLIETHQKVDLVHRLGFSKCRLSLAVPRGDDYRQLTDLHQKRIATSYPRILSNFLQEHKIEADIHEISGSVEIAPSIGLTDAICDIVSSGSTLMSNGLKEVEVIFRSEAVLIAHPNLSPARQQILDKLIFRIKSVQAAKNNKYILLNAPKDAVAKITSILPGMKSPTIVPLAEEGWVSIHSVINENAFWDIIDNLRAAGAQGILVVPIEKMIM
ncbi:ATP phosphoribosyltransferase [Cytophagaceae bacterium DM2B3-1]|uniref:ATP phosphoribosyltransferase n=1 Tax=Xanthocytophaga flava TaxID=3048013 RepID=A0AAE3U9B5_9BACT|nr:ATP phosphoribosyltransferase [Xanthocytophaga flavus]MDJ1471189.1 ATP phosphoribosyltransferase [Xanthocytophaga flavus]MDJ1483512.1 ATP phosphoribosyltransferase [Xanthocytophaga flavus]MDJ1495811.1 ATP phosphoribosyltransferase [Xanthocytophaga flavus]